MIVLLRHIGTSRYRPIPLCNRFSLSCSLSRAYYKLVWTATNNVTERVSTALRNHSSKQFRPRRTRVSWRLGYTVQLSLPCNVFARAMLTCMPVDSSPRCPSS